MAGYADLAVSILQHLGIQTVVVLGWSLGGHVAIELIPLLPRGILKGIMITGTPPALGFDQVNRGFKFEDLQNQKPLAGKSELSEEEVEILRVSSLREIVFDQVTRSSSWPIHDHPGPDFLSGQDDGPPEATNMR